MKRYSQRKNSHGSPRKRLRVLVTAGPTREFFDPVRFLSNPSSGRMGYALAEEASRRGHRVVLIAGPVSLPPPSRGIRLVKIISALQMHRAVLREAKRADLVVMAAAVSDFRPATYVPKKLKKSVQNPVVRFLRNPDVLKELGRRKKPGQVLVGFAAETDHLWENALKKLSDKNLDLIVANRIGVKTGGFETHSNRAVLLFSTGAVKALRSMTKQRMASAIFDGIAHMSYVMSSLDTLSPCSRRRRGLM